MTAAVRPATPADLEALIRVLVDGFNDDPLYRWFVAGDRFDEAMALMFRLNLQGSYLPAGASYLAQDAGARGATGAAIWLPPAGQHRESRVDMLRGLGTLAAISGVARLPRIWRLMTRCQDEHPREPHWYLSLLAVDPGRQRAGIGSTLLSHVLERVDADHLPAYLENSKERNLAFYERHGFRTRKRLEFANGGPSLWLMWRDAR